MHPILDALNRTQHEWLKKLLFTFNEGNIGKFEALAPLFPKEVHDNQLRISLSFTHSTPLADTTRKLWLPETEDLPHGAHRVRFQATCE
jgi:hypothetical protein